MNLPEIAPGMCQGDRKCDPWMGILKFHPFEITHWGLCFNEDYSDSDGCSPPTKPSE